VKRFLLAIAAVHVTFFAALAAPAQTPVPSSTIASIKITGSQTFPSDQVIAASGLKQGDTVTASQIQDATNQLAAFGIFSSVNFRYTAKGDAINLEFQVQEAPSYPISFDNFPWFTDEEIAQAIRRDVGLFTGEAPDSGAMLDEISIVVEKLLASRKIKGDVKHQLLAQAVGDGMIMQFRVDVPDLRIQSVQFGDPLATDSERLKDRVSDIKGQQYSRFAIEMFENEHIRPLYVSKGYLRARIGPPEPKLSLDPSDPEKMTVDIVIPETPGPIYTWNGVTWQGNVAIASTNLDGAVQVKLGEPVDGMKIEALWQEIGSVYASHGYLDAKLNPQPQFDDAAHRVSYHVGIVEGPQYRMGEMIVTGLSVDAEKKLRQVWLIAPGAVFDASYFERLAKELARPSAEIFGEMPVHYTQFGHFLRPDTDKHSVDVLLDFK
jgi:outer membrane protein insertion porin family